MIARAVDPATASAIWNRIRAGQRNVMVRSIYSPDARGAFDQVASRVKTDAELAQTVVALSCRTSSASSRMLTRAIRPAASPTRI